VFDSIQPKPRGFSGRPLPALLSAVIAGIGEYYLASWLHLSEAATSGIVITTLAIIALLWYRFDR
jgi:hypothetical protein